LFLEDPGTKVGAQNIESEAGKGMPKNYSKFEASVYSNLQIIFLFHSKFIKKFVKSGCFGN